jgi:hypothetical protein
MQEGDVVLTPVPQADGTVKDRPAIVLREMPVYTHREQVFGIKGLLICKLPH